MLSPVFRFGCTGRSSGYSDRSTREPPASKLPILSSTWGYGKLTHKLYSGEKMVPTKVIFQTSIVEFVFVKKTFLVQPGAAPGKKKKGFPGPVKDSRP